MQNLKGPSPSGSTLHNPESEGPGASTVSSWLWVEQPGDETGLEEFPGADIGQGLLLQDTLGPTGLLSPGRLHRVVASLACPSQPGASATWPRPTPLEALGSYWRLTL